TAAKLGLRCLIIANGAKPSHPTGNALLDELLGADVEYIETRDQRALAMSDALKRLKRAGRRPYGVPLGASTPLGALGFVRAVGELSEQMAAPDAIVHAASSAGTQGGLVAGCALNGLSTHVFAISSDDPAGGIKSRAR